MSKPESSNFPGMKKYYFDRQPWNKKGLYKCHGGRAGKGEYFASRLTPPAAWEVPSCDLMRPMGGAIHQHDSAPLFLIVLCCYVKTALCVFSPNDGPGTL